MDLRQQAMLHVMIGADATDVIQKMEQHSLRYNTRFARDMSASDREALIALGFTFPEDKERDPLLVPVTLPPGWKVVPTSHYMYSDLVDPRGSARGTIGYKGGYDLWACFYLHRRFNIQPEYAKPETCPEIAALQVTKTRKVPVEEPSEAEVSMTFQHCRAMHPDGFVFYPADLVRVQRKPRYRTESYVDDTFNPHRNAEHAKLPYKRFYVEDRVTKQRVWQGGWLSMETVQRFEGYSQPEMKLPDAEKNALTGSTWLTEHYPDSDNVRAYWDEAG